MAQQPIARLPNDAVIEAIRAHHAELSAQLRERTTALFLAARSGDPEAAREGLGAWYRSELIPHATAEERTLYAAGEDLDATRLLVQGMLAEHQALVGLVAQLEPARDPLDAIAVAASAQDLFTVHLAKENDLLLPALDDAGVLLAPLWEGMHELLGAHDD
jgi:streptomycin 6-kinase